MNFLDAPLYRLAAFTEADEALKAERGPVRISGCVESQKAHIMSRAGGNRTRLIVTYDEREARLLSEDLKLFSANVLLFPAKDLLFYQADVRSGTLERERMSVLKKLNEGETLTVVATMDAVMNLLVPFDVFKAQLLTLSEGMTAELPALMKRLTLLGYERVGRVEAPGEYAERGGILDIFGLTEEQPFRIEFWDDEIDTIRLFDPETQLSDKRIPEVTVYPATELFLTAESLKKGRRAIDADYKKNAAVFAEKAEYEAGAALQQLYREVTDEMDALMCRGPLERFLPYFYGRAETLVSYLPEDCLFVLDEPLRTMEYARGNAAQFAEGIRVRLEKGMAFPKEAELLRDPEEAMASLTGGHTLVLTALDSRITEPRIRESHSVSVTGIVSYQGNFQGLLADLTQYQKEKYTVVLLSPSRTRASRMAEELREYGLRAYFSEDPEETVQPGDLLVTNGSLHRGFTYPQLKFVLLTESDIFGVEKKRVKRKSPYDGKKITSFSELSPGDYVVHESYGIGLYQGIESIETEGVQRDYMRISYGSSGTLYVPVTNLDVVQKYASSDAKAPKLSRLDSPEWKRTRSRVRAAVEEVAEELVLLYAERREGRGYSYGKDTVWQKEFEEMFPFEETADQWEAIERTKADMESEKIMDRLICGDVGFGKTEVAIRAAFKAVQEGKQVAYLVPTTILAQQHYNTFTQRMKDFPVRVDMLSRFRTAEEQKRTVNDLKRGAVDIVIGTHRLLSKDVEYKDLGLLVIDEEQRFGVSHKEKIKQMKKTVDVLTLTATPIPRTLHMSMIGVRDMSVLSEPPTDRQAIQTYVMEYSEELVREAIARELARGGQVYYVYNRVQDIAEVRDKVQALVPEANVACAHGKMGARELERVMLSFIEGEIDVLVSTTIIETGLDIPNVNTIIVHDAERYGLAQLYQLRGRVGRSGRQAYAFIMYRKNRILSEDSEKRLSAIRQFTELGSGVRIAMQDLEIRGAGALLGNAQSGHMAEVGYELYCKLLSEAIRRRSGGEKEETEPFDTLLDVRVDAYIPDSYVESESVKLELYKKISLIVSEEDRQELTDEFIDRFGDPPEPVRRLLEAAYLKAQARLLYITEIKGNEMELRFRFVPYAKVRTEGIPALITKMDGAMRFLQGESPSLLWRLKNLKETGKIPVLERIGLLLSEIKELLI
ncbi:MAG: transcription-repair coupling factor [Lachnospiraceae bacterium]|nr:transcription-repair coupling factor [Lachnospiraceae bacterium]